MTGASSDDCVIAHIGNVCPRKGQLEAIGAFETVAAAAPSVRLLLAGRLDRDVGYVASVRSRIDTSNLADRIHLLGFREDVKEILSASAFDVDGVGESVVMGETGFLIDPNDSPSLSEQLLQLVRSEDLRVRLGEAGRRRARELFSASVTADRIAGIIQGTLGDRGT